MPPRAGDTDYGENQRVTIMSERFLCGISQPVTCDTELEIDCAQDIGMDRKYPSYTLADLKKMVAEGRGNAVVVDTSVRPG
jgi:hypothetical protein